MMEENVNLLCLSCQKMENILTAIFVVILSVKILIQMILLENDNILINNLPGLEDLGVKPKDLKDELIKIYQN